MFENTQKLLATMMLAVVAVGVTTSIVVFGLLSSSRSVQSFGTVKAVNIAVYWDSNCKNATSTINWGMLSPGEIKNVTIYLRNEGNVALRLNLTTQNWSPLNASNYIKLVWNREGQTIYAGSVITATLTLSISQGIVGITNFSFDITLSGTES
jgi:hypothetical protein